MKTISLFSATFAMTLGLGAACSESTPLSENDNGSTSGNNNTGTNPIGNNNTNNTNTNPGQPGGQTIDANALAIDMSDDQCSFLSRCQPALLEFFSGNQATCEVEVQSQFGRDFNFLAPAIAAGRIRFNQDRFDQCKSDLSSMDCVVQQSDTGACSTFFEGQQPTGAPCFVSAECSQGFCQTPNGPGTCGVCQPLAQAGADCSQSFCGPNLACFDIGSNGLPELRCAPTNAQENATCATLDTGMCQGNLDCAGDQTAGLTCQRPSGAGSLCNSQTLDQPSCDLQQGLVCGDGGTCVSVTWAATGEACDATRFCRSTDYCDVTTNVCVALPTVGAACSDFGCANGHYCDLNSGTCQATKGSGASCDQGDACDEGLTCMGDLGQATCQAFSWFQCN